jgi:hypothetical protein
LCETRQVLLLLHKYIYFIYTIHVSKKIIPRDELQKLYWDERKSSIEIAKIYHCHSMTVRNRIHEFGIVKRSPSDARIRYEKYDFSGSNTDKAYMLGFRLGDLSAYQTSTRSDVIVVRCHTTQMVQVRLMENLFSKYGKTTVSEGIYGYNVNCFLNTTFRFLLPKHRKVPMYAKKSTETIWAFIAGYVDAEGHLAVDQEKARFKIDSYDLFVLKWINTIFEKSDIRGKFRRIALKGQPQSVFGIYHKDLWRLEINDSKSLYRFIHLIGLYLQHEKRRADMDICLKNIQTRNKKGTIEL